MSAAAIAAPPCHEIAFTSFAPLDTDGSNAKPFLPHPDLDCNASFSRDGKWIVFTSTRAGSADIYRAHRTEPVSKPW